MTKPSPTSSEVIEGLVRRAICGDPDAQQALLVRYRYFIRRAVRTQLRRNLPAHTSYSDIEQEVALDVLRSLTSFTWKGQSAFTAWLRHLVVAEVIDVSRYQSARRRDANLQTDLRDSLVRANIASPESWLDEQRRLEQLETMLDELSDAQAQAVVLYAQGHSHKEIGEILGVSEEAARKHVARGHAKLAAMHRSSTVGEKR